MKFQIKLKIFYDSNKLPKKIAAICSIWFLFLNLKYIFLENILLFIMPFWIVLIDFFWIEVFDVLFILWTKLQSSSASRSIVLQDGLLQFIYSFRLSLFTDIKNINCFAMNELDLKYKGEKFFTREDLFLSLSKKLV